MSSKLEGKIALITGAAAGIGRATTELFAAEGARVIATDIRIDLLDDARLDARVLDVRDGAAISALAESVGGVDVLVNCAGFVHAGTVLECDEADWDFSFDLNVKSMYRTIRAFLPAMLARGSGSIVNLASAASSVKGVPNRFVYGTTKAAVIGLTKAVAADFVTRGIRCNAICPGATKTNIGESMPQERLDLAGAQRAQSFAALAPAYLEPSDIAGLALFLASDDSRQINGAIIPADGGWAAV